MSIPESYKALISFDENKYLGKKFFRIIITILLFSALVLVLIGYFIKSFSFYFHGLAGYALDLFDIPPERHYNIMELCFTLPNAYEHPNNIIVRFIQLTFFVTIIFMPIAMLINVISLWLIPLPRKTQKFLYTIAEILNAWSCLDVFVLGIIAAITELAQFTKFIVGDKCDIIDLFIAKYFYKALDGYNTCFAVKVYLKSGCWMLFTAAIIFLISSSIVMKVCRNALKERLPENVKEYLKNLENGRINSLSNLSENNNISNSESKIESLLQINNSRNTNNKGLLEEKDN